MRLLLFTLLLATIGDVQANTWELPNRSGGKIVATDRPCPTNGGEGLLYVYSHIPSGETLQGCWTAMDNTVVIMWNNGKMTVHAIETFTPVITDKPYVEPTPVLTKPTKSKA